MRSELVVDNEGDFQLLGFLHCTLNLEKQQISHSDESVSFLQVVRVDVRTKGHLRVWRTGFWLETRKSTLWRSSSLCISTSMTKVQWCLCHLAGEHHFPIFVKISEIRPSLNFHHGSYQKHEIWHRRQYQKQRYHRPIITREIMSLI